MRLAPLLLPVLLASACTSTYLTRAIPKKVEPIQSSEAISLVCIKRNTAVREPNFLPLLKARIEARGYKTEVYEGAPPEACSHIVDYTAHWRWDFGMRLVSAEFLVHDRHGPAGSAIYEGRSPRAQANPAKFNSTESKVAPLIDQLFPPAD